MKIISIEVRNKAQITNRNVFRIVREAEKSNMIVYVSKADNPRKADLRSMLGVLSLNIEPDDMLVLESDSKESETAKVLGNIAALFAQ